MTSPKHQQRALQSGMTGTMSKSLKKELHALRSYLTSSMSHLQRRRFARTWKDSSRLLS